MWLLHAGLQEWFGATALSSHDGEPQTASLLLGSAGAQAYSRTTMSRLASAVQKAIAGTSQPMVMHVDLHRNVLCAGRW